ncbi:MAG: protein kinase [Polyangiaceae bacterium]
MKARLGRGGMGDVYLAQHAATGALVAVKRAREVDAAQLASLRREIYALSRLRHPGIVRLVDHGTSGGQPWCALEFVDGQTLQALLTPHDFRPTRPAQATTTTISAALNDTSLPSGDGVPMLMPRAPTVFTPPPPLVVARCLSAMRSVCDALAFLHGEGIVHCDLKPANVVLRPGGHPVIIDFGLMVHFSGPHGRERLDEAWAAVGTYEYMAPERIRRELVDARADLYAVGCILYEILTGRPPFLGDQRMILRQHVAMTPPRPSEIAHGVRSDLDDLVLRLLEKNPRARLGYADAVAAALAAAGVEPISTATPHDPPSSSGSISSGGHLSEDASPSVDLGQDETLDATAQPSSKGISPASLPRKSISPSAPKSMPPSAPESAPSKSGPGTGSSPSIPPSMPESTPSMRRTPAPRAYLYRPSFAGHGAAMRRITVEPGGLVLIGAESGAGKTRLAMEVGRVLAGEMRIITGECLPVGTEGAAVLGAPLHPLQPMLRAIADECRSQGPGMVEMLLGNRGRVLADYEPSLLELPEVSALSAPARLSPEAAQQRLYAELAETMFAFAMLQRLVLIIDDLQWADELTLGFLRSLSPGSLSDQGVLVVGTYRKDEAGEALWKLAREPHVKRIDLERLDRTSVASIARDMLALSQPPEPLVDWLYACSEGNPFFVAEYLRSAVEEGLLARDAGGNWTAGPTLAGADLGKLPVPGSVRDLLEIRLDALGPGAQLWVSAACVIGREIDREVLERVARSDGSKPTDAEPKAGRTRLVSLEELLARQILEEIPRGFRFVHDMLREVAYERLSPTRRKSLHLRAARAIEEVHTARGQLPSVYASLAHHYGAAEVDDKTFLYLERAAESALKSGTYVQAYALLTRLMALDAARGRPSTHVARARWSRWLGESAYALGDLSGLATHTAEGLAELGRPLPTTSLGWGAALATGVAKQLATFVTRRVKLPTALSESPIFPQPSPLSPDVRSEIAQMAAQIQFRYYFSGDALRLVTTSLFAVNEAESASGGTPQGLARPYAFLGMVMGLARLHPVALSCFRRAAYSGREADDPDGVAFAFTTEAVYRLCLCEWEPAERAAQEALAIQMANANSLEVELIQTILGHIEYFTGRFAASRRRFQSLHDAAARRHHEQHRAWGLYSMARCDVAEGRETEAIPLLAESEQLLATLSDEASELIVDGLFVSAHLGLGDVESASIRGERLAHRIDRLHVPTVFSTVHAYVALAELRLLQWERAPKSERRPRAAAALRAIGLLSAFAAMFPLASPAAQRCAARARYLAGARKEALKALAKSAATARKLEMPYEEVLAVKAIERIEAAPR